ncbi:DEAD/DEAH box helicase [Spiroplasma endosymbiont of Aspidapion aeneum]|uniref:DEAD/DEAH box helicase n=1 Tax=Spiroplasma endosymbiont of Aspidapion aeneum TaxID=3066276 RepID=UPI00313E62C7
MKFTELDLNDNIIQSLNKNNFFNPTEIQKQAIPAFLRGDNIFGLSSTGTGKTASFVLPIIERLNLELDKIQAIIITPTRELALQIIDEIRKFSTNIKKLKVTPVIGGANLSEQQRRLRNTHIIVGTPGRIRDHIERKNIRFGYVKTIILDEADEMLKMGFQGELNAVFDNLEQSVQVGLFSATSTPKVLSIAERYMQKYELIKIDNQIQVNNNIDNSFIFTKGVSKEELIIEVFKKHNPKKVIIFTNTRANTDRIQRNLRQLKIDALVINGDKKQSDRSRSIRMFKSGEKHVLVATDVAARGLDVNGIDYVINYDISMENEHFVHRIGRTGRNNEKGSSISFVQNRSTLDQLKEIQKKYNISIVETKLNHYDMEAKAELRSERNFDNKWKSRSNNFYDKGGSNFNRKKSSGGRKSSYNGKSYSSREKSSNKW